LLTTLLTDIPVCKNSNLEGRGSGQHKLIVIDTWISTNTYQINLKIVYELPLVLYLYVFHINPYLSFKYFMN